jgi:hypothetical protein
MNILRVFFFLGLVATQVFSRTTIESVESFEDQLDLSFEGSSEESSNELPLKGGGFSYNPSEDGDPDEFLDNFKKSLPKGSSIPGEEGIRKQFRAMYKDAQGTPLPEPSSSMKRKLDQALNNGELERHNELRAQHGAAPLEYDEKLAAIAQNWAEKSAKKMKAGKPFVHNYDETKKYKIGENMAGLARTTPKTVGEPDDWVPENTGQAANMWYSEIKQYKKNGNRPTPSQGYPSNMATGHFTQVVWADSKKMGCGQSCYTDTDDFNKCVVICNYYPAGNTNADEPPFTYFKKNVNMDIE